MSHHLLIVAALCAATLVVNLPFGYWRGGLRKLSPAWFAAIHAPVPIVMLLRWLADLPFSWERLPLLAAAYFAGQWLGVRLRRRREAQRAAITPAPAPAE